MAFLIQLAANICNSIFRSLVSTLMSDIMDQTTNNSPAKKASAELDKSTQILDFTPSSADHFEIFANDVIVNSVAGTHNHGSSKVKLKNIVDYNWENRLYAGQLLAVHMNGDFIAYGIKVPSASSAGLLNGMVRVAHRSSEKRALLKGMHGQIQDLAFALISTQVILACIDEGGNIFIYNIELNSDGVVCTLLLNVVGSTTPLGIDHRIVWCPYVPDVEDAEVGPEEDGSKLLVTTHGKKAVIWNIGHVITKYGAGPHLFEDVSKPCYRIEEHTQPIVEAAFSPDGSALATASRDGLVLFFQQPFLQVYNHCDELQCLFRWSPHAGKPISSLFFLDSRSASNTEQFWKSAVTGCDNNSIIKIWSCKNWSCLQTITFAPSPNVSLSLKPGLDKSAQYMLLSDITRRSLFILQFHLGSADGTGAHCKSICECYLPYPFLSFGDIDTSRKVYKCPSSCSDPFHHTNGGNSQNCSPIDPDNIELDDMDSITGNSVPEGTTEGCNSCTVIRMYLVQPKSLQEGTITLSPIKCKPKQNDQNHNESHIPKDGVNSSQEIETSLDRISLKDEDHESNHSVTSPQQPLNSILAQQSQQLKNILMRAQFTNLPTMADEKRSDEELVDSISDSEDDVFPEMEELPSGGLLGKQPPSPLPPLTVGPFNSMLQPPLNLMTPDAFNSPAKRDEDDPPITVTPDIAQLPPVPIIDNDLHIINNSINLDSSIEQINSIAKGFPANPTNSDGKFASGGSSPSREVQEILSLKGSDYYEDGMEEDLNTQTPRTSQPPRAINTSCTNIQEGFQLYSAPDKEIYISPKSDLITSHNISKHSTGNNENSETVWPSINMAKINEANQRKANNDKCNSINKSNNSLNLSTNIHLDVNDNDNDLCPEEVQIIESDVNHIPKDQIIIDISSTLQKLTSVINEQQKEIAMLRSEVSGLRLAQNSLMTARNNVDEGNTFRLIEQSLQRNQTQVKQLVDSAIASRVESDRANREALLSGVSQIIGVQMAERLNAAMAHEARTTLVPGMEKILDPIARSLQLELARALSTTDHLLTENIQKLVNSKSVMDNLCLAVAQTLSTATRDAFKEAIQTSLVPNMEKAQTQMFKQLNQTFSNGTKEYLTTFETCTKRTLDQCSTLDETCGQINGIASQLQQVLDQQSKQLLMTSQSQQTIKQLNNLTKDLQSALSKTLEGALENQLFPIKECIKEQISTGMAAHVAQLEDCVLLAVTSRTQTPAPSVMDMQTQIEQLLATGQTNAAFQQALSASDLKLVVLACSLADLRQVFSEPCPLQQHVLLSLIQQLSADMNSDTQLKHRYLEGAVTSLDRSNPVTREHIPLVLKELQKQLSNFIACNPYNENTRNLKVLMLITEAVILTGETGTVS